MLARSLTTRTAPGNLRPYPPVQGQRLVIRRTCAYRTRRSCLLVTRAAADPLQRSEEGEAAILNLTDSLRLLETERDEAVKTAESCARTAVKLEEMTRLLERLALDKVTEGDEAGSRQVLQEKAAVSEVLSRTSGRAQTNYTLAAKLAEKIGQQQAELLNVLGAPAAAASSSSSSSAQPASATQHTAAAAAAQPSPHSSTTTATAAAPSNYASSGSSPTTTDTSRSSSSSSSSNSGDIGSFPGGSSSSSSSGGGGYEAPWERSLAEARGRIKQAEEEAAAAGRWATWQQRESLEVCETEARERLRAQAWQSVDAARSRIHQSASESIEQARARIAAEDAAVLAQVHGLISRYKAGGYVPEEELDWAFRQLERRSWRQ